MSFKDEGRPVSENDINWAIKKITEKLASKFGYRLQDGWSDACLASELYLCWREPGGCYLPNKPNIEYEAKGLKVWISWQSCTNVLNPTFEGESTLRKVREVYKIPNPDDGQLFLI